VNKARSAGGSGLGLAISREIVQAHGGRCWVESSAEDGTTFTVRLPELREAPTTAAGPAGTGPLAERGAVIPVGSAGPAER
jgi:signal transduction histidine kinase